MILKVGSRLFSGVDDTEVIVVRAPAEELELACGGVPMRIPSEASSQPKSQIVDGHDGGSELGKRYVIEELALEVLVTRAGSGSLTAGGRALQIKEAKSLPASD